MCEMEMPTPCQSCNEIFELTEGYESKKWFQNTSICENCSIKEEAEVLKDGAIEDLKKRIDNALYDIKEARSELQELGYEVPLWINTPLY